MKYIGLALILTLTLSAVELFSQTPSPDGKKRVPVVSKDKNTEFSPTISADGRTLIFESRRGDKWELYESQQNESGEWSEPVPLKAINDKCHFLAGPSLGYDGNTLFYTAFIEDVTTSEDIFYSVRLGDKQWSEPRPVGPPINTDDQYEGFPSVSSDGSALYFIRVNPDNDFDKKAKEPCFNIFVSHKKDDGSWGEPQLLPPQVNSGCVRDPRIMADNHTLIFSAIRPEGAGKYDLFQTRLAHDGNWAEAVPLDFVNSPENDQSPCISASGTTMFYYSNDDIWQIGIPEQFRQMINITVQGKVTAAGTDAPLEAGIVVKDLSTGEIYNTESSPADGKYSLVLSAGKDFEVIFFSPGYVGKKLNLAFSNQHTYLEKKIDVALADEWKYSLTVEDKDLRFPVRAFVRISSGEGIVFADSLSPEQFPKQFDLSASKPHNIEISAPRYTPLSKPLVITGDTSAYVEARESIEHMKVKAAVSVTEVGTGEKKRVKVTYNNQDNDEVIIADAGEVVNLRHGDRYQVMTNSEKGLSYAIKTIVAGEGTADETGVYSPELSVAVLEAGTKLTLHHIHFETSSWKLSDASALELESIVGLLRVNPNLIIEISAHTDDVGSDAYNNELSAKRASSVTQYLVHKGVRSGQMVARGYGKTKPLVDNDTDDNRAMNRRVELLVLKVD